jgi:hypothetical protein
MKIGRWFWITSTVFAVSPDVQIDVLSKHYLLKLLCFSSAAEAFTAPTLCMNHWVVHQVPRGWMPRSGEPWKFSVMVPNESKLDMENIISWH